MPVQEPWTTDIEELLIKAARCRRLAETTSDARTMEALLTLAGELEAEAERIDITDAKPPR